MKTITTLISFIFIVNYSVAQPGTLDSSFGINGISSVDGFEVTRSMVLQGDGKIVVAGYIFDHFFVVARYNTDGSIDESFGEEGTVKTSLVTTHNFHMQDATSVALQSDGKILVGGTGYYTVYHADDQINFLIVRYNTDGSLDESFGDRGAVISDFELHHDELYAMVLQPDGKISAGGISGSDAIVARYNADGSIDTNFGNGNGWIRQQLNGVGACRGLAAQNDGNLLMLARVTDLYSYLYRFKIDGTRDSSFGLNGRVVTNAADHEELQAIALQDDGKILATGYSYKPDIGTYAGLLFRYNQNGSYDTSFGDSGKVITKSDTIRFALTHVIVQPDKQIITSGSYAPTSNTSNYFGSLIKYNKGGTYNRHFGTNGLAVTTVGNALNIALQQDGKLVVLEGKLGVTKLSRYNNTEPVTVSLTKNIKITEGNSDIDIAHFEVVLNKISKKDVHVIAETKDVTAVAGEDYKPILRKVTINAGSTSASIDVKIKGDTLTEGNEKFLIVLSNPVNAIIGKVDTAVCTIEDDDALFAINASSFNNAVNNVPASIKIYPNPVNNHLLLSGLPTATKTTLSIIDLSGNSRLAATVTGSSYSWNVGQLKAGSYILRIENGDLVVSKMFIKE